MTDWTCKWCGALNEGDVCENCGKSKVDDVARVKGKRLGVL